jgi:integrase
MAQAKKHEERVLGPYPHGNRWRVIVVDPEGDRTVESFETEEEAWEVIKAAKALTGAPAAKLSEAIGAYGVYLRDDRGNKKKSYEATTYRLECFFQGKLELPMYRLTSAVCESQYQSLRERPTKYGKPMAVDSHRNMLAEAKTFGRWCVVKKYLRTSPLEEIEGKGKRRYGKDKPQLRFDSARVWLDKAKCWANEGEDGAVMAMMAFLMDMRAEEVVLRKVEDVDNGGTILWTESKTEAGKRQLAIPEDLQPYLMARANGREPGEHLFPSSRSAKGHYDRAMPRDWSNRISKAAGVIRVGAHGLRRSHATLADAIGVSPEMLAKSMGHETPVTTRRSYIDENVGKETRQKRVLVALAGGKRRRGKRGA